MIATLSTYGPNGALLNEQDVLVLAETMSATAVLVTLEDGSALWVSPADLTCPPSNIQRGAELYAAGWLELDDLATLGLDADEVEQCRAWGDAISKF
jgi:hypothetical protein